jgi:hypothetical protein
LRPRYYLNLEATDGPRASQPHAPAGSKTQPTLIDQQIQVIERRLQRLTTKAEELRKAVHALIAIRHTANP